MSRSKSLLWIAGITALLMAVGCDCPQKLEDMKAQNRLQQQRIDELENELGLCSGQLQKLQQELASLTGRSGADMSARDATIAALEADIEAKKALIAKMQEQLLRGGTPLPPEMNMLLQDFAKNSDLVTFDPETGSLKFKSDLLFNAGSDEVQADKVPAIKALAAIMNSEEGKQFDMVIVGHTDDLPIKRAATLQKHPTNWHLSTHRAISVEELLNQNGIAPQRLAVKGYGEFRPLEPNKPNKKGNPVNRRVEIFIIPGANVANPTSPAAPAEAPAAN
jgi:chemotaxis protein MotB